MKIAFWKIQKEKKNQNILKNHKNQIKKPLTAEDDDNILRKIQDMFLSFIMSFTNDIVISLSDD